MEFPDSRENAARVCRFFATFLSAGRGYPAGRGFGKFGARMAEEETRNLTKKLREIEEQCAHALAEIPAGLTHSRVRHIRTLTKFVRMSLEGQAVAPVEPMREDFPAGERQH